MFFPLNTLIGVCKNGSYYLEMFIHFKLFDSLCKGVPVYGGLLDSA